MVRVDSKGLPKCGLCDRTAFWSEKHEKFLAYCARNMCDNRERLCKQCGVNFTINANGAGTKYCSDRCREFGYHPFTNRVVECATGCGRVGRHTDKKWPYVCEDCRQPLRFVIDSLRKHNVPWERASVLFSSPGCEICGKNLLVETKSGQRRSTLTVDHDHRCCPGSFSCGLCVRGFLCQSCNLAIGLLQDNRDFVSNAVSYFDKWTEVGSNGDAQGLIVQGDG